MLGIIIIYLITIISIYYNNTSRVSFSNTIKPNWWLYQKMNNYAVNINLEVTELFCISTEQTNFTTFSFLLLFEVQNNT